MRVCRVPEIRSGLPKNMTVCCVPEIRSGYCLIVDKSEKSTPPKKKKRRQSAKNSCAVASALKL